MFTNYNKCEASPVAQNVKTLPAMWETWVGSLGWEDPLDEGRATPCSIFAWRIPWTEEPGGLQPTGSQRVRHDWGTPTHVVVAGATGDEGGYPRVWAGLYVKSTYLLLHLTVNLTTLFTFLSLKISLWLFKLLSQTFHFPICFKCPCNCRCSILWQLFKILIILGSVSFSFGICWFSFHSTSDFPIFDSREKELILITSYQVEVSPAFPLSLCGHLVGRFYWFFRGGVGIKTTPIRPPFLLHWLRGQLFLGLYGHGLLW